MANVTDPFAKSVHGTDPQNLVEYITRQKIYSSRYWKEECFGLSAKSLLEKAAKLTTLGGSYGENRKPCHFLALLLKMLQIQPDEEIVFEMVRDESFKYVRALGACYLRLTGRPKDIYEILEPLYKDRRKLRIRTLDDWEILHMDEYIDCLLKDNIIFQITLPRIPKRYILEETGYLDPRESLIGDAEEAEKLLEQLANQGNISAQNALEERAKLITKIK